MLHVYFVFSYIGLDLFLTNGV